MSELSVDLLVAIVAALVAGLIAIWGNAWLLRRNKRLEQRTRFLIEAYRNLEDVVERSSTTPEQVDRLESAIADIFLFGSDKIVKEANTFSEDLLKGKGSSLRLLNALRHELRDELGLKKSTIEIRFLRIPRDKTK